MYGFKFHKSIWDFLKRGVTVLVLTLWLQPVFAASILQPELLAKAQPDECFNGVGMPYDSNVSGCTDVGEQPKVNQAYVWGMTKTDTDIWFGTAPNTLCMVNGTYHQMEDATENSSWVCELKQSKYPDYMAGVTGQPSYLLLKEMGLGDWRVPKMYRYNIATSTKEDVTPSLLTPAGQLLLQTLGLRSAGTHNGVVFLAGPGFGGANVAVNMFAFNAQTGALIGAHSFPEYNNIRKWIVANGELYTAVGANDPVVADGNFSGRVLKWTGDVNDPFNFVEVGYLPGSGAELALHEGRLFVTTWPGSELPSAQSLAGLYMSLELPQNGGLATATVWKEIWKASDYEPDLVVAATYGGGAVASFDGYLYWGTMHVPGVSLLFATKAYDLNLSDESLMRDALEATNRAISIYRATNFDDEGAGTMELLYGEEKLKQYNPLTKSFVSVDNKMGMAPIWGESGFGNGFNNYTWTMNVFKNKLYIGTMDWSYLVQELGKEFGLSDIEIAFLLGNAHFGADLWRIDSSDGTGAEAENTTGVGNYGSYGIRTMVSDDEHLYLGMANPMNLMTDTTDDKPEGGWELIQMTEDTPQTNNGGGGGCAYNPNQTKYDMMLLMLFALSLLYPWRKKLFR